MGGLVGSEECKNNSFSKVQRSVRKNRKDIFDYLALESTILKSDEIAFLANELKTEGAEKIKLVKSSKTGKHLTSDEPRHKQQLTVVESRNGRVFCAFWALRSLEWGDCYNVEFSKVESWLFQLRPFKKERINVPGIRPNKHIGPRYSAKDVTFTVKHIEILNMS